MNLHELETSEVELDKQTDWLKQRQGKFTASNIHRLMTYEDKDELPKGALTYIEEVAIDILTEGKGNDHYLSSDMERGNEMELTAVERFEQITGLKCYATGDNQQFIKQNDYLGGTPDGLINNDALIEVKCPKSKTHFFNLNNLKNANDLKKHYKEYYWQIQANLSVTNRKTAYFISFDDRFLNEEQQILIIEVERCDLDIEKLQKRVDMATNELRKLLKY
ncbi:lambda exonuclease family protein [Capnocytophaga canimorsus]|uniref:lambda exonuclease family protein n=1 Tax=Capnocytophaga canimorsus TaxID=28188 RepID=UPI00384D9F36